MHLNQDQKAIYLRIVEDPRVLVHFEVLSAEFEAALDEFEDPEKTDPYGVAFIRPEAAGLAAEVAESAAAIAAAWLEMVASAIMAQDGEIESGLFDEDGVSAFCDTRPLFEVAKACGIGEGHARRAFARIRRGSKSIPRRAMKILGSIGAIKVPRRKSRLRQTNRVRPLAPCFAASLDRNEIARAKAGSLAYSLVARKDGYEAVRVRRKKVRQTPGAAGASAESVIERDDDVMDGFSVPLVPCEELHGIALDQFIQFLDEERVGKKDKAYSCTYQRLVHRARPA